MTRLISLFFIGFTLGMGALLRLSGIAGIIGGLSFVIVYLLSIQADISGNTYPYQTRVLGLNYLEYGRLSVIPIFLMLMGLLGLHSIHKKSRTRTEAAGFVVALAGIVLQFVGQVLGFWVGTRANFYSLNVQAGFFIFFVGLLSLAIGMMIFGVAAFRAGVLPPRVRVLPFLIGPIMFSSIFSQLLSGIVFGVAWAIIFYSVYSEKDYRGNAGSMEVAAQNLSAR